MKLRELREDEVVFEIQVQPEEMPVRGNAMASGDPAFDKEVEDKIIKDVADGDEWAWCSVTVKAKWAIFEGTDTLGCCSYVDEESFKTGGYYEDMKSNALAELNNELQLLFEQMKDRIEVS